MLPRPPESTRTAPLLPNTTRFRSSLRSVSGPGRGAGGVAGMARAQGPIEQTIRKRVADHPDAPWLKWKDQEVPWRDVLSYAQRAANGLLELGEIGRAHV